MPEHAPQALPSLDETSDRLAAVAPNLEQIARALSFLAESGPVSAVLEAGPSTVTALGELSERIKTAAATIAAATVRVEEAYETSRGEQLVAEAGRFAAYSGWFTLDKMRRHLDGVGLLPRGITNFRAWFTEMQDEICDYMRGQGENVGWIQEGRKVALGHYGRASEAELPAEPSSADQHTEILDRLRLLYGEDMILSRRQVLERMVKQWKLEWPDAEARLREFHTTGLLARHRKKGINHFSIRTGNAAGPSVPAVPSISAVNPARQERQSDPAFTETELTAATAILEHLASLTHEQMQRGVMRASLARVLRRQQADTILTEEHYLTAIDRLVALGIITQETVQSRRNQGKVIQLPQGRRERWSAERAAVLSALRRPAREQ
jgi:hypothetical protein